MSSLRLKGAGWSCAVDESDMTALTTRLRLIGRWSLASGIEDRLKSGSTEMTLSKEQKRDLLATLKGMRETQTLSTALRRVADDLESDLCGYDYSY